MRRKPDTRHPIPCHTPHGTRRQGIPTSCMTCKIRRTSSTPHRTPMSSCPCPTAAPMWCRRSAAACLCTPGTPHPSSPRTLPCRSPPRIPMCCTPHRCRPARSSLAHTLHRSAVPGPSRPCSIDIPPPRHQPGRVLWLRRHSTLHNTPSPMHLTPYTSASKPFPTPQPLNPSLSVYALTLWLRRHSTLHNTPFALHPTLYNLRPTSRTSHPPCTFTLVPQLLYTLP